jgi:hypothetical protein
MSRYGLIRRRNSQHEYSVRRGFRVPQNGRQRRFAAVVFVTAASALPQLRQKCANVKPIAGSNSWMANVVISVDARVAYRKLTCSPMFALRQN